MTNKRFDFEAKQTTKSVCTECQHYYDGSCDSKTGVCNAFIATRETTLEQDVKRIKKTLLWLIIPLYALALVGMVLSIVI